MPPVDLVDLARLIRRALVRPGGEERRSDAGQVVLQDRAPASVPERLEALTDDSRADGRVGGEHRRDALGERVEPGADRSAHAARRLGQAEAAAQRVPAHPQLSGDRRLGAAFPMEGAMDLGPVLHLMHSFLPRHELVVLEGASRNWMGVLNFRPARSAQFQPTSTDARRGFQFALLCTCKVE